MKYLKYFSSNSSMVGCFMKLAEDIPSFSIKLDHILMELEQSLPVRHCEKRNFQLFSLVVQFSLHIDAHCTCALVQDREKWLMVEKSSHGHSLFFSSREHVIPVVNRIESSFSFHNIGQLNILQDFKKVLNNIINTSSFTPFDAMILEGWG